MAVEDAERVIRELANKRLLIGIPMEKAPRQGEPITNASLGYINEFGSPARNIPPRPFLIPGVRSALPQITEKMQAAARAALDGDEKLMLQRMGEGGLLGVRSVTRRIQAGIPPPLADSTVARRRQRTPGSSYRRKAQTQADVTPLIDTGNMIRSITWVIREGGSKGRRLGLMTQPVVGGGTRPTRGQARMQSAWANMMYGGTARSQQRAARRARIAK